MSGEIALTKINSTESSATNVGDANDTDFQQMDSETQEEQDHFFSLFVDHDTDVEEFYDFTEAIKVPDASITFPTMRMLQTVHILPNRHVLIEGNIMDSVVEVYQVEADQGSVTAPIHTIATGCRGLNQIVTSNDHIYMGFMMSMTQPKAVVQCYSYEYDRQHEITIDLEGAMFTGLALCLDNTFMVGTHSEGRVSVINLQT